MGSICSHSCMVVIVLGLPMNESGASLEILAHPYWDRAWIKQEIVKATRVAILFGNQVISWQDLIWWVRSVEATMLSILSPQAVSTSTPRGSVKAINAMTTKESSRFAEQTLPDTLHHTRGSQCTDRRDSIYAKLSLVRNANDYLVELDYSVSIQTVFKAICGQLH